MTACCRIAWNASWPSSTPVPDSRWRAATAISSTPPANGSAPPRGPSIWSAASASCGRRCSWNSPIPRRSSANRLSSRWAATATSPMPKTATCGGAWRRPAMPSAASTSSWPNFGCTAGVSPCATRPTQHELCTYIDCNVIRRLRGAPECSAEEFRAMEAPASASAPDLREKLDFGALLAFKKASRHYGEGRWCRCALILAGAVALNPAHILSRAMAKVRGPEKSGSHPALSA